MLPSSAVKPLLLALLLVSASAPAFAGDRMVEATTSRDTAELARTLGILHQEKSGLLVLATSPYDRVLVGLEGAEDASIVVCGEPGTEEAAETPLGLGCIRTIVYPIEPGHLDVSIQRADATWAGALLLVAGDVAILDVEALLALAAEDEEAPIPTFEFDFAAFRSKLAGRRTRDDKAGYCRRVLAGLPSGDDKDVVAEACGEAVAEAAVEEAKEPDALAEDVDMETVLDEPEVDPDLVLLYHPDGRPRTIPRGTIPRRIAAAVALGGLGASIGGALYWESEAERTYLDFRRAERVGDDPAMSEHLFFTKQNDRNRDVALGVGVGLTVTAFAFLGHQLLERRLFLRAKQAQEDAAKLEGAP